MTLKNTILCWPDETTKGVDLSTGKIVEIRKCNADYNQSTKRVFFDRFIDNFQNKDKLQNVAGYLLTSLTCFGRIICFYGSGDNGITSFVNVIASILGSACIFAPTVRPDGRSMSRRLIIYRNFDVAANAKVGEYTTGIMKRVIFDMDYFGDSIALIESRTPIAGAINIQFPVTFKRSDEIIYADNKLKISDISSRIISDEDERSAALAWMVQGSVYVYKNKKI
jgi:hypothetical protein